MMPNPASHPRTIATQYGTSTNLDARIRLHADYSTNQYGWLLWVFDHLLSLPATATILELGCGTGKLWAENAHRIPAEWQVTLTDQSQGMLDTSAAMLDGTEHPFHFEQVDAQKIPFGNATFDAVVANHMLYHVPELSKTLGEIHRVLKPGGTLFAATNGRTHMVDLSILAGRFREELHIKRNMAIDSFLLENGAESLSPFFPSVHCDDYEDAIVVDQAAPLVDYILSISPEAAEQPGLQGALTAFVQDELVAAGGQIRIEKATGLFVATKGETLRG